MQPQVTNQPRSVTPAAGSIIRVRDLTKSFKVNQRRKGLLGTFASLIVSNYKTVEAVKGISFEVERGELLGYVGPNGAGKSTSIKMLTGILTPSQGEVLVNGLNPHQNRRDNAQQIGVVFGQRTQLWWDLPLLDSFELLRHVYKVSERTIPAQPQAFP